MAGAPLFIRVFRADVRMGRAGKIIPFIAIVLVAAAQLISVYASELLEDYDVSSLGFSDNLALIFAGKPPHEPVPGVVFIPPLGWLFIMMLLMYATLAFPSRDINGIGQQLLVREGKRAVWWLSKCLWTALTACEGLLVTVVTALLWTFAHGQDVLAPVHAISMELAGVSVRECVVFEASGGLFFVGVVAAVVAVSLVQLALSVCAHPNVAYLSIIAFCIASAFAQSPLLPGNLTMLARWSGMVPTGVPFGAALIVAVVLGAAAVVVGALVFLKHDLLRKEVGV